LANSELSLQPCESPEKLSVDNWLKISTDSPGTLYYAKEIGVDGGNETEEYLLRRKRLKGAPKLYFRIVVAKYEHGCQVVIEESQYPPVTFINKSKYHIRVGESSEKYR
jgi:hypothetical protein